MHKSEYKYHKATWEWCYSKTILTLRPKFFAELYVLARYLFQPLINRSSRRQNLKDAQAWCCMWFTNPKAHSMKQIYFVESTFRVWIMQQNAGKDRLFIPSILSFKCIQKVCVFRPEALRCPYDAMKKMPISILCFRLFFNPFHPPYFKKHLTWYQPRAKIEEHVFVVKWRTSC